MLQDQLNSLYQETWIKLNAVLPKNRGISNPLFIDVPDAYETAPLKLMVIGKETNGWVWHLGDPEHAITPQELIKCYANFNLGEKYVKSPFWAASHELQRKLSPSVPPFGFVWSNLFICDQNRKTPEDDVADILRETSILQDELRILRPDVVVFFTGWYPYDYTVAKLFPSVAMKPVDGGDGNYCRNCPILRSQPNPSAPITQNIYD